MTSVRSNQLLGVLREIRSASDPKVKQALLGVASEIKARLQTGAEDSRDFFLSVSESVQGLRGTGHARLRAECLFGCCQHLYLRGESLLALLPARHMHRLFERYGERAELRRAQNMLGILNGDTSNFGEAIEWYSCALGLAREIGDIEAETATWINISVSLVYMSRYEEALACLQRAQTLSPHTETGRRLYTRAAHNMSLCYLNLGELGNARRSSEVALSDVEPVSSMDCYSRVLREHHYVEALLALGEVDLAKRRVEIASVYAAKAKSSRTAIVMNLLSALVEANCGDGRRAARALEDLFQLVCTRRISPEAQDVLRALSRAYEWLGDHERALHCLQETLRVCRSNRHDCAIAHLGVATELVSAETRARRDLAQLNVRQADLRAKLAEIKVVDAQIEVLERLAVSADLREEESGEHGFRVGRVSAALAGELGWRQDESEALERAARLHDIGKIGIPDRILLSSESLQASERKLMSAHTSIGAELLSKSNLDQLRMAEEIARCHHEWWDGTGYPNGLEGKRIPIAARIVALADVFDALTHGRTYQKPWTQGAALEHIESLRGKQFDPDLTDRFLELMRKMLVEHTDLDAYLGRASRTSGVLRARDRIRAMLHDSQAPRAAPEFDLATSKS